MFYSIIGWNTSKFFCTVICINPCINCQCKLSLKSCKLDTKVLTALVHVAQLQCSSEASVVGVLTFQALATFVRQRDRE